MKVEIGVNNLRIVKEILDESGIDYWLDNGTLLGAFRDGKIIEWDRDIDFGAWYNKKAVSFIFSKFKKKMD